jgi:hypothetical protein
MTQPTDFMLRMIFIGEPVPTPDQVRGRLSPDHAPPTLPDRRGARQHILNKW